MKVHFLSQEVQLKAKRWPKLLIGGAWIPANKEHYIECRIGWLRKAEGIQVFEKIELKPNDKLVLFWNNLKRKPREPDLKLYLLL